MSVRIMVSKANNVTIFAVMIIWFHVETFPWLCSELLFIIITANCHHRWTVFNMTITTEIFTWTISHQRWQSVADAWVFFRCGFPSSVGWNCVVNPIISWFLRCSGPVWLIQTKQSLVQLNLISMYILIFYVCHVWMFPTDWIIWLFERMNWITPSATFPTICLGFTVSNCVLWIFVFCCLFSEFLTFLLFISFRLFIPRLHQHVDTPFSVASRVLGDIEISWALYYPYGW